MKSLAVLLMFLFTLSAYAQEYPDSGFTNKAEAKNQTVNGLKEGKWCEYRIGVGTVRETQRDSSVDFVTLAKGHSEDEITNDTNSGYVFFYTLTVYKAGKPYGILRWYSTGGHLKSETPYKNGMKNGVEKIYYSDGKLLMNVIYTNNKAGIRKAYDETGNEIKEH